MKKRVKALLRTHKAIKKLESDLLHVVHLNQYDDRLHEAKRLHADVYRSIDFVDDSDIIDGIIHHDHDPHQLHSFYFGVYDKNSSSLLATARQIESTPQKGLSSFPVIANTKIKNHYMNKLTSVNPSKIVEISALVKTRGAGSDAILYLLREMLRRSINEGHEYWVMALDVSYNKSLKAIFGDSYEQIGEVAHYKGGDVVPCLLSPKKAASVFRKKSFMKNMKTFGAHKRVGEFFADVYTEGN